MATDDLVLKLLSTAAAVTRRLDLSLSHTRGVSFSEYQLLSALATLPDSTGTRIALAERVALTPSGVTRALKPLEKIGFVETRKDERDARRSLAALTPAGVELLADADDIVADALAELGILEQLSDADRKQLHALLDGLAP